MSRYDEEVGFQLLVSGNDRTESAAPHLSLSAATRELLEEAIKDWREQLTFLLETIAWLERELDAVKAARVEASVKLAQFEGDLYG